MQLSEDTIKEILLSEDYVSEEDLKAASEYAAIHRTSILDYLMSNELISEELYGQAIAEHYNITYANLRALAPAKEQVEKIPMDVAKKYRIVLFQETATEVLVATDNPEQPELAAAINEIFPNKSVTMAYTLPALIDASFIAYNKSLDTRFSKILKENKTFAPEILQEILLDAVAFRASDIHFEPQGPTVVIRFRIDGVMHEAGIIPKEFYENVLNRIKVQSKLRIDEHMSAQDGSMQLQHDTRMYDIRTSIVPTVEGEKIVLRLLSSYIEGLTLSSLGVSEHDQATLLSIIKKPFGMLLVVGPTGSGKTTTLYALLHILNQPNINITTIEDPVEYKVPGINQIQVNEETKLTFAKGLRSIVRQDPDVVLVGEIRDQETAEIAVNAALTGHLLLSTFHANDAATSLPRLLDMGVEPFLLASTLEAIVAQRLVRKICNTCKTSMSLSASQFAKKYPTLGSFFPEKEVTLYYGKGCSVCGGTGFQGRSAIYEIIAMTPTLKALVLKHPSTEEIWKVAQSEGTRSMFEDGVEKVRNGITTIEELLRVAIPPIQQ